MKPCCTPQTAGTSRGARAERRWHRGPRRVRWCINTSVVVPGCRTMYSIAAARTWAWNLSSPYTWWLIARNMQLPSPSHSLMVSPIASSAATYRPCEHSRIRVTVAKRRGSWTTAPHPAPGRVPGECGRTHWSRCDAATRRLRSLLRQNLAAFGLQHVAVYTGTTAPAHTHVSPYRA